MVMNQWYEMPSWFTNKNIMAIYWLPFKNTSYDMYYTARITVFNDRTLDFDFGEFIIHSKAVEADDITNMSEVFVHNELTHEIIVKVFNWRNK